MKSVIKFINEAADRTGDWALLAMRLILALGFYHPAVTKFKNIYDTTEWFASMNFPLPKLSVLLVGATEFVGFFLLMLGFLTRYISIPLMFIMLIAITVVHMGNGYAAADNGFEIPLYYMLMLLVLLFHGAGKISIDGLIDSQRRLRR